MSGSEMDKSNINAGILHYLHRSINEKVAMYINFDSSLYLCQVSKIWDDSFEWFYQDELGNEFKVITRLDEIKQIILPTAEAAMLGNPPVIGHVPIIDTDDFDDDFSFLNELGLSSESLPPLEDDITPDEQRALDLYLQDTEVQIDDIFKDLPDPRDVDDSPPSL